MKTVISDHPSWNRIYKPGANLIIAAMYWARTICQAPCKVCLFIHWYIGYVLSTFHGLGLTLALKILRLSVPWMQKPVVCHAALAFIPLVSIFPKRMMLFWPVKSPLCPRRTCEKEASSAPKSDVLLRILCLATRLFTVWPWANCLTSLLPCPRLQNEEK